MSDALNRITLMANQLMEAGEKVAKTEIELAAAKAAYLQLERTDLPELMRELEIMSIKLENGASVEVVDDLSCSISEARREAAYAWLTMHGFDGIIKTDVIIHFDRGESERACEISERINEEFKVLTILDEGIHPQTLKSFVKERKAYAANNPEEKCPFPDSLFGVFEYRKAKITLPKIKKVKQK